MIVASKTTKTEEHGKHAGQDDESKAKAAQHSTISKSKHSTLISRKKNEQAGKLYPTRDRWARVDRIRANSYKAMQAPRKPVANEKGGSRRVGKHPETGKGSGRKVPCYNSPSARGKDEDLAAFSQNTPQVNRRE